MTYIRLTIENILISLNMQDTKQEPTFICINCGNSVQELYKKYSNSVKAVQCEKCHKVADKYIEFEPVIILVDAMLLSEKAFRHMLFNRDFKLHWKLSLVLLLLESFALWRKKLNDNANNPSVRYDLVHEKGFYICCLQNVVDYLLITALLLAATIFLRGQSLLLQHGLYKYTHTLLKAVAIANFSKFFLLPIMVWRENTTAMGANIHQLLVMGHHLCSLIFVFDVVFVGQLQLGRLRSACIVLPIYVLKEYWKGCISTYIEQNVQD